MAVADITSLNQTNELYKTLKLDDPAAAPTAANGGTLDTTFGQDELDELENVVTRQAEIIACLQGAGLMS